MTTSTQYPTASPAALTVVWGVVAVVAVLPLLVDLPNVDDTYYGIKVRALLAVSAVMALGLLAQAPGVGAAVRPRGAAPLLAFAGAASLAAAVSVDPGLAVWGSRWRHEGLLVLLAYLVVCAASTQLVRRRRTLWVTALLAGGGLSALYGAAQYAGYEWVARDPLRAGWVTAFAATGHPNYFGALMTLTAPFAAAAALASPRWVGAAGGGVLSLLMFTAGLCSFSRAAWAGLLSGAVLMALLVRRLGTAAARRRGALLLAAAAAVTVLFVIPGGPLARRDGESPIGRAASVTALGSKKVADRFYLWAQTLPLALRRPVTGYGPDTFAAVFPQEWDERRRQLWGPAPRIIDRAHNDTLDTLMSVGVLGLAAYWWIIVSALRGGLRAARAGGEDALWGIAAVSALTAYLLTLQFGFSVVSVAPVFWSAVGAARAWERPAP